MTTDHRPYTRADVAPDLADRMAKALHLSGISVNRMAELLECHRNSIGGWLNRRAEPFPATLMMWAQLTGVPYEWLKDGDVTGLAPAPRRRSKTV